MRSKKSYLLALGFIVLGSIYLWGASQHSRFYNIFDYTWDQSVYVNDAIKMRTSGYRALTSRNRMPMYSFLQSLFYSDGVKPYSFFKRGKMRNAVLSLGLLAGLFFIFICFLTLHQSINLTLITAFAVFIFKSAYFQCELLFYFLNFIFFLLCLKMLRSPNMRSAIGAGVVAGLAYLTKASVLPAVAIFALVFAWRTAANAKRIKENIASLSAVLGIFLLTCSPYLINSYRYFGHAFYNVGSTLVLWHDSWEEAVPRVALYDSPAIKTADPATLPSWKNYRLTHSPRQIWARLFWGMRMIIKRSYNGYGYFSYMVVYLLWLALLAALNRRALRSLVKTYRYPIIFAGLYFSIYFVLHAWYAAIDFGPRFTLAHFIPLMFGLAFAHNKLTKPVVFSWGTRTDLNKVLNIFISAILALDIYLVLARRIFITYGGT